MKSQKNDFCAQAQKLCARLHPEDGGPPIENEENRDKTTDDRKTKQLCSQVAQSLAGVLPIPGEAIFEGVAVELIEPAPDASRLRIVLCVPPHRFDDVPRLRTRVEEMTGYLRSLVAAQIHRKRVPMLTFDFRPTQEVPE